jgi:transcriptional regulator with XRE-family HTH domain
MNLRKYLLLNDISENAFAKSIGASQAAVNRYCKGRVPAPVQLKAIIRATHGQVTANDFFGTPSAEINSHPVTAADSTRPDLSRPVLTIIRKTKKDLP